MASSLSGLRKTLTWAQFRTKKQPKPEPGESGTAAFTHAAYSISGFQSVPVAGKRPAQFRLKDDIAVNVTLKSDSWVASWVADGSMSSAERSRLLKHEQGHYDIVALLARDLFNEITSIKGSSYASPDEPVDAVTAILDAYGPRFQELQDLYDDKTDHGINRDEQTRWNGLIGRAFTEHRLGGEMAPAGRTPQPTPLVDVLKDARVLD